jgi:hypothetical protein
MSNMPRASLRTMEAALEVDKVVNEEVVKEVVLEVSEVVANRATARPIVLLLVEVKKTRLLARAMSPSSTRLRSDTVAIASLPRRSNCPSLASAAVAVAVAGWVVMTRLRFHLKTV